MISKYQIVSLLIVSALFFFTSISSATTEYSRNTGLSCKECHVEAIGGSPLTKTGEKFLNDIKIKGQYRQLNETQKIVRFFIGYIHLIIAIAWFGTIIYVHILLKPAYALRGLPKGELLLGWTSIIILSISGTLLTIARIPKWEILYTSRFGILLSIKIFLFLLMVTTAVIVTFFVGPRMKRKWKVKWETQIAEGRQDLTIEQLHSFDGKEGRPAYIVYKGKIYDVTKSKFWKDGSHMTKHLAGHDLTDVLKTAPHGEEKILPMPAVGKLISMGEKPSKPFHERIFYLFAYLNLLFIFLIVFVIALWRWG